MSAAWAMGYGKRRRRLSEMIRATMLEDSLCLLQGPWAMGLSRWRQSVFAARTMGHGSEPFGSERTSRSNPICFSQFDRAAPPCRRRGSRFSGSGHGGQGHGGARRSRRGCFEEHFREWCDL